MTGTWLYAGQSPRNHASLAKLGSWYLLLYVAFVTVTLASREALRAPLAPATPPQQDRGAVPA